MVKIYQLTFNHTDFLDGDRRRYYHEGVADLYHGRIKTEWSVHYGLQVDRGLTREVGQGRWTLCRENGSAAALVDGIMEFHLMEFNQNASTTCFNRAMEVGDVKESLTFQYYFGFIQEFPPNTEICMKGLLMIVEDFHDVADIEFDENDVRFLRRAHYLRDGNFYKELSDNLGGLLKTGSQADVVFKCENKIIPAHKLILSARSAVFAVMFESGMNEKQNGVVDITDMDFATLKTMLVHIYTSKRLKLSYIKAVKLIYGAEKYQLDVLKEMCSDYLKSCLSKKNALSLLVLGDLLDQQLKTSAMEFICNHVSDLQNVKNWNRVKSKHPALAAEVMELYSKVQKSQDKDIINSKYDFPVFLFFVILSYVLIFGCKFNFL